MPAESKNSVDHDVRFFGLNMSAAHSIWRLVRHILYSLVLTSKSRNRRKCSREKERQETACATGSFSRTYQDLSQISDNLFGIPLLRSLHEPLYPFIKLDSKEVSDLMI